MPLDFLKKAQKDKTMRIRGIFKRKFGGGSDDSSKSLSIDFNLGASRPLKTKNTLKSGEDDLPLMSSRKLKELLLKNGEDFK